MTSLNKDPNKILNDHCFAFGTKALSKLKSALTYISSGNRLVSLSLNINICLGSGPPNPETEHFAGLSTRNLKILINSIRDLHNCSTLLYSQYIPVHPT